LSILVVASHTDDEVLGYGASISKWAEAGNDVHILIMEEGVTSQDMAQNPENGFEELSGLQRLCNLLDKLWAFVRVDPFKLEFTRVSQKYRFGDCGC
jgi:hypothetical protein